MSMRSVKKLFCFDVAGCLADPYGRSTFKAVRQTVDQFNPKCCSDEIQKTMGLPKPNQFALLIPEAYLEDALKLYYQIQPDIIENGQAIPKVKEALETLHEDGHVLAVNTGYTTPLKPAVLSLLKKHGLWDYIKGGIVFSDEVAYSRPKGDMIRKLVSKNLKNPHYYSALAHTYAVGDTNADICAGIDAGVNSVWVSEYTAGPKWIQSTPTYTFPTVWELAEQVKNQKI